MATKRPFGAHVASRTQHNSEGVAFLARAKGQLSLCELHVLERVVTVASDLIGRHRPPHLCWAAKREATVWYLGPLGHERACAHDAVAPDPRTVEENSAHADDGVVADRAALSCTLLLAPMMMGAQSALTTAPCQTELSVPIETSPVTVADAAM